MKLQIYVKFMGIMSSFYYTLMHDIANRVSSSVHLCTDDCILYRVVKCENDSVTLQLDLDLYYLSGQHYEVQRI